MKLSIFFVSCASFLSSSSFAQADGLRGEQRELLFGHWWNNDDPTNGVERKRCEHRGDVLEATVRGEHFEADIEACYVRHDQDDWSPAQVRWSVDIKTDSPISGTFELKKEGGGTEMVTTTCDSYNWHIHAKPAGKNVGDCGAPFTGGHVDASLACGPASEYKSTTCQALGQPIAGGSNTWLEGYGDRCSSSTPSGCEYGDLSGKLGKIPTDEGTSNYYDNFLQRLFMYDDTSIVLHCCILNRDGFLDTCSPRVACGTLALE